MYFYSGSVFPGGSSRVPDGPFLRRPRAPACRRMSQSCASVTRVAGSAGTNLATDYRCYMPGADAYNYQPFNLIMTPQERGSIFANYEYDINEAVQLYAEVLYSRTTSGFQIAPLPFDALADDVVISARQLLQPEFGYELRSAATAPAIRTSPCAWRPSAIASARRLPIRRWPSSACAARCSVPNGTTTSWLAIAASTRPNSVSGYLYQPGLSGAFGPSFDSTAGGVDSVRHADESDSAGPVHAGQHLQPGGSRAGHGARARSARATTPIVPTPRSRRRSPWTARCSPCPPATRSCRSRRTTPSCMATSTSTSSSRPLPPLYLNCFLAQETCTGPNSGGYDVKEISAEVFLPLVKDVTGMQALNLTIGTRFSDYSTVRQHDELDHQAGIPSGRRHPVERYVRGGVPCADHPGPVRLAGEQFLDVHGSLRRSDRRTCHCQSEPGAGLRRRAARRQLRAAQRSGHGPAAGQRQIWIRRPAMSRRSASPGSRAS